MVGFGVIPQLKIARGSEIFRDYVSGEGMDPCTMWNYRETGATSMARSNFKSKD